MKRLLRTLTTVLLAAALVVGGLPYLADPLPVQAAGLSKGVQNIIARAYQQVEIEWTPWYDVPAYEVNGSSNGTFWSGVTYHGIPYGQVPFDGLYVNHEATMDEFLAAVADKDSDFYTKQAAYGSKRSPWYSNDCSAFASYCYGLGRHTTGIIAARTLYPDTDLSGLTSAPEFQYLADVCEPEEDEEEAEGTGSGSSGSASSSSADEKTWDELIEPGDCVNIAYYHVAMITGVTRAADGTLQSVEVCEQVPPYAIRATYTPERFLRRFGDYELLRFIARDGVAKPVSYTAIATGDGTEGKGFHPDLDLDGDDDDEDGAGDDSGSGSDTGGTSLGSGSTGGSGSGSGSTVHLTTIEAPEGAVTMYRLYYPDTHEHLYTSDKYERYVLVTERGWEDEGLGWFAPETGDPVYRLFNPYTTDHHYTKDKNEYDTLGRQGWEQEGIGWYSAGEDGLPLYRLFTKTLTTGAHHYTTDANERKTLVSQGAWIDEGIGWYGIK